MTVSGLPPIDQSLLPADIRTGSTSRKQTYEAALGFERQFLEQLTQQMVATTQSGDDSTGATDDSSDSTGDSTDGTDSSMGTDAATQNYMQMLPGTLADALVANGGIGLARQLVPVQPTITQVKSS